MPLTPSPKTAPPDTTGQDAYARFVRHADTLARPLIALMKDGQTSLPIDGRPSDHGEDADRLEAFARPLLVLALWLKGRRTLGIADHTDQRVRTWAHEAIVNGADPAHPGYFGTLTNYHQHAVEFAILTMALDIAKDDLWAPLPEADRNRVLAFLAQIRGHGGHRNNHLFFDVLTLEFLNANNAGAFGDDEAIRHHLAELECMHRAEGWFIDGGNESYDHYNAYAFHIYGLWWAARYGTRDPACAQRWRDLAAQFLPSYADLYAASGEPLPIGRSLTYRFNGVGAFALAAMNGIDAVPLGSARKLTNACIEFFLARPVVQTQGCLSVGWTNPFEGIAEPYTCAGSPYWAAKGLLALALDPDHPFFAEHEHPFPAETDTPPRTIAAPGWLVEHRQGEVVLTNAGGSSSMSAMKRFGAHKWGKLVYHTGVGGLLCASDQGDPIDAQLTARHADGGPFVGRHNTMPIRVTTGEIVCQYQLGIPYEGMNTTVRTHLWRCGDWFVCAHVGTAYQPTVLRAGGFALAEATPETVADDRAIVESPRWRSEVRAIHGFASVGVAQATTRQHIYADASATPFAETPPVQGDFTLVHAWAITKRDPAPNLEVIACSERELSFTLDGAHKTVSWPGHAPA